MAIIFNPNRPFTKMKVVSGYPDNSDNGAICSTIPIEYDPKMEETNK